MSEMESFKPKEKPVPVNQDTKQERLEDSHTPNVTPAKDDGQVPAQVNPPSGNDNGSNSNDTENAEIPSQRRLHKLGITGTSSMSGKIVPSDENGNIENNDDIPPVSPSIPGYSPNKEASEPSDWKDLGIVNVPLSAIPAPDVQSPEDFTHNITWKDAQKQTSLLPKLQEEVAAGKTGEDFSAEDEVAGRNYTDPDGRRRQYDLYYGSQPVKLAKIGDQYNIDGGHHRIYAAKAHGLQTIPARVKEKQV